MITQLSRGGGRISTRSAHSPSATIPRHDRCPGAGAPSGWQVGEMYRYSYDLGELKQPVMKAVVCNGWTWQPVITFVRAVGG